MPPVGTTDRSAIVVSTPTSSGYRTVTAGPGEPHLPRTDLSPAASVDSTRTVLLTLVQLSDIHVCDAQSPARAEFLDRWGDPDSPLRELVGIIGSYRPQEMLTTQVCAAGVAAANAVSAGPVGGAPVDLAVVTGDLVDNAQGNETGWYLQLLEGGELTPDSGATDRWEGVAAWDDPSYWHPETGDGRPTKLWGFPVVRGLLDAVRRPFTSAGLQVPWLAVHGNHDQLVQGTIPPIEPFSDAAVADRKVTELPFGLTTEQEVAFHDGFAGTEQAAPKMIAALWPSLPSVPITPDPARRMLSRREFLAAHERPGARPARHGFADDAAATGHAYYRADVKPGITLLALDTVNEWGGWQGSLDRPQFTWLAGELSAADADRRLVVLTSHHRSPDMTNGLGPDRVLGGELLALLAVHPCAVLWLNGHSHANLVHPGGTFWEVTAPSLIDFPQQGRVVELIRGTDGILTIAVTMLDHAGELPWSGGIDDPTALAGLSRELAANDWQVRQHPDDPHPLAGTPADRNVLLYLRDPFAGADVSRS
jgi:metallophosphoesterase (TIGR03767 family)